MSDNLNAFTAELNTFSRETVPKSVVKEQQRIAKAGLESLVNKTPVKTGRARGNWFVSIGSPETEPAMNTFDKTGTQTIRRGLSQITRLDPFEQVFISNSVPYILFLERGRSQQAPNGMMAVTVVSLESRFGQ